MNGNWQQQTNPEQNYLYNGKELNDDFDLGLTDFGNRWQDPATGRFTTIDRFANMYASMTPFQYGANNPIKYIDVNGDSLKINFIGAYAEHAENKFYGIVNNSLEGQFILSPNSDKNLQLLSLQGGSYDNLSKQGKAVYDELSTVLNRSGQVEIDADYATTKAHTGNFKEGIIDVADILQFNEDKTELGGTQIGKIVHEVVEQADKQIGASGFKGAHANAIFSENKVNGSSRTDSGTYMTHSADQIYSRDGKTVRTRIQFSQPSGFLGFGIKTRRVISVTNK